MKNVLYKILRIFITLIIITLSILGFIFYPIITTSLISIILVSFIWTEIPYKIIATIFRIITKSNYVCITLPYQDRFITVRKKDYKECISDKIKKHEQDHIKFFNERLTTIQCLIYIAYTIWYGYYNNPVEIRARKAEEINNG